jgi:hypothetical protein
VLELPLDHHSADPKAMLRQTGHGFPLINGYSGYQPPHYLVLSEALRDQLEPDVVKVLQGFGPLVVLVSRNEGVFEEYRALMDAYTDATRIGQTQAGVIYRLPERPPPARDTAATLLGNVVVDANSHSANAALMLDGDIETRWETAGPQSVGHAVSIRTDGPTTFSRVEMDLGKWHGDYPRRLRIDVVPEVDAAPIAVWEELLTGETMLGLLENQSQTRLVIDLPAGVTGRELRLVVTTGHPEMSWSVAELRVYGKPAIVPSR